MISIWAIFVSIAAAQAPVFERDVLPILERNCLGCHNQKLRLGALSMASPAELSKGGKRGPAVIARNAKESRLAQAIRHEGNLRMPPAKKLPDSEIATIERWIAAGAAMPTSTMVKSVPKPNHWSFLPPKRAPLPAVKNAAWVRNPIDRFVLARLEKEGITPSPEAERSTLLRRAHLDVTGLPPMSDKQTWEQVTEALLASPHFGERWGRHWLDQARYADSDGGSRDEPRQIWRYREWVIRAFNQDMPFDRFVVEQLAGDLLPNATNDQLIATGFHRNSPIQIEAGTDREQYRVEAVVDRVDTTGTVFFGMSVGCARCHDHKFDPISNREYYQLYAFFNSSDDWSEARPRYSPKYNNLIHVQGPLLEFAKPDTIRLRDETLTRLLELEDRIADMRREKKDAAAIKELEAEAANLAKLLPKNIEGSMIMRELPSPRETHMLQGGDYLRKGERVTPGVPSFLHAFAEKPNANRLDLARWMVSDENPLLARVTVNRIWQEYFGRGLVETENDFGTQGTPPTHPELLDWLAREFIESGWSQKHVHRLILNSAVYRQSSKVRQDLMEKDPRNLLLARQTRLRLDAEIVRDVALSASGLLNPKIGGPSVFPPQPDAAMSASQLKKVWKASTGDDRYRRGMYTFFWRITPHPALIVFDAPSGLNTCTRRTRSNTPLQALAMLNETAFHEFAQALALRLFRESPADANERMQRAFALTVSRTPQARELARLQQLLATERDQLQTRPDEAAKLLPKNTPEGVNGIELAAWISLSRVLMNTDEFITRE